MTFICNPFRGEALQLFVGTANHFFDEPYAWEFEDIENPQDFPSNPTEEVVP